jgi:VWFA-related protein
MRIPRYAALVVVTLAVGVLAAQEQPTFRTGTNLVRVDVSVVDRSGNPVTTLAAEDFDVREDGRLQTITSFKLIETDGQPTDDFSLPIRGPLHAAAEAARDDVRVFLIFWDEYHIGEHASALFAREGFKRVMIGAFGPTDLVAVMDQLTLTDSIRFSRDRRALADQVHALKGRRGVYFARSSVEEEQMRNARGTGDLERIRSQVTASAMKSAAAYLGRLRQGRKSLIVISESLGRIGDASQQTTVVSDLIRTANDSNTAIYVIDPRGFVGNISSSSSPLATIAYGTGGQPLVSNDIASSFSRVVKQSSASYLLGYATDVPEDGRFHEIKVRVRRPGVEVRSRAGYWAPRATDLARSKASAIAAVLPPPIAGAFASLTPLNSTKSVDVWAGTVPAGAGRVRVSASWTPRAARDRTVSAEAVSLVAMSAGVEVFRGKVPEGGVSFDGVPGQLQLTFAAYDRDGAIIDRVPYTLAVPDPASPSALVLTTPALVRARNALEWRTAMSDQSGALHAGREFTRTDRLLLRFAAHGGEQEVALSATLLDRRGAKLLDLPVAADAARNGHQIDLPLASIAQGEYVIAIEARSADTRADAHVALRVTRPNP